MFDPLVPGPQPKQYEDEQFQRPVVERIINWGVGLVNVKFGGVLSAALVFRPGKPYHPAGVLQKSLWYVIITAKLESVLRRQLTASLFNFSSSSGPYRTNFARLITGVISGSQAGFSFSGRLIR